MISVVLPVYNGERHLAEALRSLQQQTFEDFECLCYDDGGTDSSASIVERLAAEDSRFRLIRQTNRGVATTRNRGLSEAKGEYVAFLDQDDAWAPTAFEKLLESLQASKCDLAVVGTYDFPGDIEPPVLPTAETLKFSISDDPLNDFFPEDPALQVSVNVWGKLYRREALKGISFPDGVFGADDYIFSARVFQRISSYVRIDEPLYLYRMHAGNVTMQMPMRFIMGALQSREIVWAEVCKNPYVDANLRRRISKAYAYDIISWAIKKTCRKQYSDDEMIELRNYVAKLREEGVLVPRGVSDRIKCNLFLLGNRKLMRLFFPKQFSRR